MPDEILPTKGETEPTCGKIELNIGNSFFSFPMLNLLSHGLNLISHKIDEISRSEVFHFNDSLGSLRQMRFYPQKVRLNQHGVRLN